LSAYQPLGSGSGRLIFVCGSVRSILIPATDADCELPALSETLADAPRLSPSPAMTLSAGAVPGSTPERSSDAVQWIATSPLYQPFAFGSVVAVPARSGGVRSMLIPPTVVVAVLSAVSFAPRVTDWPAPSLVSVTSSGQTATFESASSHLKWTVTSLLYQPFALAGVVGAPLMVGGVLSSLTVIESVPVLPATSSAWP
jgi:hypothetical protein